MKKKQAKQSITEKIFFVLFLLSLSVALFVWGWSAANWESYILVALFVISVFGLTLLAGIHIHKKKLSQRQVLLLGISALLIFGFGTKVSMYNWLGIDYWISGSIREIKSMFGVELDPEIVGEIIKESGSEIKSELQDQDYSLRVNFEDIPYPMLMSFDSPQKLVVVQPKNRKVELIDIPTIGDIRSTPMAFDGERIFLEIRNKKGPGKIMQVRLKDGKFEEVWSHETVKEFHHWGDVYKDKVYMLSKMFINLPDPRLKSIADNSRFKSCVRKGTASSSLIVMSTKDGSYIEEIELLPLLAQMDDLPPEIGEYLSENCHDLLHLNDLQTVKNQDQADLFPNGKPGDLIVSMRNINLIVLLDRDTHKVKWHVFGDFYNQHSPRLTDRGTLLVFDNLGGLPENGMSRIVEIDVKTKEVVGVYEASGDAIFNSKIRGRIQIVGGRIFVMSHEGGEVFELICETKYLDKSCQKKVVLDRDAGNKKYFVAEFIDIFSPPLYEQ